MDWIERLLHVSRDGGNGVTEVGMAVVAIAAYGPNDRPGRGGRAMERRRQFLQERGLSYPDDVEAPGEDEEDEDLTGHRREG